MTVETLFPAQEQNAFISYCKYDWSHFLTEKKLQRLILNILLGQDVLQVACLQSLKGKGGGAPRSSIRLSAPGLKSSLKL